MKAVIQADVRACDPPTLAVRVDEYTVAVWGPDALGRLSRVDTIARETRYVHGVKQEMLVSIVGVPAASPVPPVVIHTLSVKQEPIAWVTVGPTQWEVRQEHIHTEWPPAARSDPSGPDLAAWLLEQIAEDERVARAVSSPAPWVIDDQQRDDRAIYGAARGATVAYDPSGDEESRRDFAHIVRWDPARVLAECAAKRQIIELHGEQHDCTDPSAGVWPYVGCDTLRLLALPYADCDGYREEWKP